MTKSQCTQNSVIPKTSPKLTKYKGANVPPNNRNIEENGRSMVEMLGVLAVIGVLSVGGIAGYSKAMQKYRINKMITEIASNDIGEMVMDSLKEIDEISYVRFASVYRQFKDINTFLEEIKGLVSKN